jgi:uncharacterized protein
VPLPKSIADSSPASTKPDYEGLVRFLFEPFLESPEALKVDCEVSPDQSRFWLRIAFSEDEVGRVYGRGRRNIHAVRSLISAVSEAVGDTVYLDVFGA